MIRTSAEADLDHWPGGVDGTRTVDATPRRPLPPFLPAVTILASFPRMTCRYCMGTLRLRVQTVAPPLVARLSCCVYAANTLRRRSTASHGADDDDHSNAAVRSSEHWSRWPVLGPRQHCKEQYCPRRGMRPIPTSWPKKVHRDRVSSSSPSGASRVPIPPFPPLPAPFPIRWLSESAQPAQSSR
jgi:hypothetical protein